MKMSPDGAQLFFMDNTMAFLADPEGNPRTRQALFRTQRFSRRLVEALDRVTAPTLEQILAEESGSPYEILTPGEINAVVARRDAVRRYLEGLIVEFGARNVLAFP
jgi:hypothetical protein